jgi:hypothetical protein
MSAGIKANVDGSGAIQVGGTDYITISSAGEVAIPQTFSVTGALTASTIKSNTSSPPTIQNSSGTEIGTLCRAWVNFDGNTSPATIEGSFNVSSVSKSATGRYTVNFSNDMPNTNYVIVTCSSTTGASQNSLQRLSSTALAKTSVALSSVNNANANTDLSENHVAIFA